MEHLSCLAQQAAIISLAGRYRFVVGLLGAVAFSACTPWEVEEGEMTLMAQTQTEDGRELKPVLLMRFNEDVVRVDGMTTETSPGNFLFTIEGAPPREFSVERESGEGKTIRHALARLALVPSSFPESYKVEESTSSNCAEDTESCVAQRSYCFSDVGCLEQTLSCERTSCEQISGKSMGESHDADEQYSQAWCNEGACLFRTDTCSEESGCVRRDFLCEGNLLHSRIDEGETFSCTLSEESGSSEVRERLNSVQEVTNYQVVYANRAGRIPEFGELSPGYNLLKLKDDLKTAWVDYQDCLDAGAEEALARRNERRNTQFSDARYVPPGDGRFRKERRELQADCEGLYTRVSEPAAETLVFKEQ